MLLPTIEQIESLTPTELIQLKQDMDEYRKELLRRATDFHLAYRYIRDEMKCRIDILELEVLLTEEDRITDVINYDHLCRIH